MVWPFWIELLLRSGALLLAAEAIRGFTRVQDAGFRYKLILWSLVLLALLPVFSILFPEIAIAWPNPVRSQRALVTVREVSSAVAGAPAGHVSNWLPIVWIAGVILAMAQVAAGAISAWRVAGRARLYTNPDISQVLGEIPAELSQKAEVRISEEVSIPLTCGMWRSRILLPDAAEAWDKPRLSAVLLHELAHVRRRDVAVQVGVHVIAALWWFQPLVWVLRRRLRTESELACDAEALRFGFRPSQYAAELLAIAKSVGRAPRLSSSGIGMARSSDLEDRLRVILSPAVLSISRLKICGLVLALGSCAVAASAVTFGSHQSFGEQGGSTMKRTIISGLLASAGLSAATVSGSIHDANGAPVSDAKVMVFNPDTGTRQETATDSTGRFSVDGASAGQYIMSVEKSGFVSLFREFDLKADSRMERQFTMTSDGGEQVADQVVRNDATSQKPIHVRGEVAQNNLTRKVQPVYPVAAKKAAIQGTVEIEATISKDGVPIELRVVSSPSNDLSESSLEAVRQWRYRPTLLNGEPIEVVTMVIINYTLAS